MRTQPGSACLGMFVAVLIGFTAPAKSAAQSTESPATTPKTPPPPTSPTTPTFQESSESRFRRGLLAMPYLGVNIPVLTGGSFDIGFRGGALLGWHVNPVLSLNGETTIDVLNPSWAGLSQVMVDVLFSPLLHFGGGRVEGFVGPKVGWYGSSSTSNSQGSSSDSSEQGVAYGFNVGVAIPLGPIGLGGLFSCVDRHPTRACTTRSGQPEQCVSSGTDFKTLSVAGLVLF
jgi:hypothetical protein